MRGTYVTGLTEHDIQRLDWFEGSEYSRREVNVVLLKVDGQHNLVERDEVQTETYVFTAGRHRLEIEEWDYEVFRKEKMHRWADLSEEEIYGKASFLGLCARMLTQSRGRRGRRSGRERSRSDWRTRRPW